MSAPPEAQHAGGDEAPDRRLPRVVVALGWVSLLTDAASDMIVPLVPALLASLGGGAAALGLFEGVSELVSALTKLVSGRASDTPGRPDLRRTMIGLGYGLSTLARPLYALATGPAQAIAIRALDRVGKGLRGPPRDAVIADATRAEARGHAFGFHRMMDNLGGVLGPAIAFGLLEFGKLSLPSVFALTLVPGALSVAIALLALPRRPGGPASRPADAEVTRGGAGQEGGASAPALAAAPPLGRPFLRYLLALAVFGLAASGDLFLLRRLSDLGLSISLVPVAWLSLQLGKSLTNVPGGKLADRLGRRRVLAAAWLVYALAYAGFGLAPSWPVAWLVLAVYAVHYGLAEGGQRALAAELVPSRSRGRAFGFQLALEGALVLPVNVGFGAVYDRLGAPTAFIGSAAIAVFAALLLALLVPEPRSSPSAI